MNTVAESASETLPLTRARRRERFRGRFASLRFRLILSVALVHAVLMGTFVWEAVRDQSADIRAQLVSRGHELVTLMAVASTNALLAEDLGSLGEVTDRVKRQPGVVYGDIVDIRGDVLASSDPARVGHRETRPLNVRDHFPLKPGDHVLDLSRPIEVAGRRVGTVLLGLSTRSMDTALEKTRDAGLLFILMALVVGSVAAWALSMIVTRNLHILISAVRRIAKGDLDVRVNVNSRDEVGILARAFNGMVASLQRTSREVSREHEKRTEAERLACVGELAASIAHEIRNPLAAVVNAVPLLDSEKLDPEDHAEALNIINAESRRLQRILEDFLRFSRMREPQPVVGDLGGLLEEVSQSVAHDPAVPATVGIRCHVPAGPCRASYDPDLLRQVLWNLLLNAIQAMPEGGTVDISTETLDGQVRVTIADTGTGIPHDIIDKVMRPFFTRRGDGTGLGLAIVQRILMQHGSKLSIDSEPGHGTRVTFQLPAG
ncbi:MAG TPA: ATP-binding protein [Gammaproteobacteria bacterium]|nr:ATP-binding protein [Gammaproteobacteria bacterium]